MPIVTIIECDVCHTRFEIKDNEETPGAAEILQITDAMSKKKFLCTLKCLDEWRKNYVCPYKNETKMVKGTADEYLPGLN